MRTRALLISGSIILVCLLNMGVIRKNEDPVGDTQTDPVTLKKKLEELKDGPKGAPKPSFKFYIKDEKFQVRTAVETFAETNLLAPRDPDDAIPAWGDPVPEDLTGLEQDEREDWWAEDGPAGEEDEAAPSESKSRSAAWEESW